MDVISVILPDLMLIFHSLRYFKSAMCSRTNYLKLLLQGTIAQVTLDGLQKPSRFK